MTAEKRTEVIDIFISIGEKSLKGNKHFHLEPILARDTIQAIKELEKENAELAKHIIEQQKTIGSLTDTIDKLKAQNEKMQCCQNCKHEAVHGVCVSPERCTNLDKWELKDEL